MYVPLSEAEFAEVVSALDEIGRVENRDYSDEEAMGIARQYAEELADEALEAFGVEWSIVADRAEEVASERVIEVAEEHECDHTCSPSAASGPHRQGRLRRRDPAAHPELPRLRHGQDGVTPTTPVRAVKGETEGERRRPVYSRN